jgi:hypothetical protein
LDARRAAYLANQSNAVGGFAIAPIPFPIVGGAGQNLRGSRDRNDKRAKENQRNRGRALHKCR